MTGTYRVIMAMTGVTAGKISRADVAHFLLREVAASRSVGQTPLLKYLSAPKPALNSHVAIRPGTGYNRATKLSTFSYAYR
jgi:hypothetical protein